MMSSSGAVRSTSRRFWMPPGLRNVQNRVQNVWQMCWPLYQWTATASAAVASLRSRTTASTTVDARTELPVQTNQRLDNYLHLIYLVFSWQQPMLTLVLCAIFHLLFILTVIMDRGMLGSFYWLLFLVSVSDALIEAIVFNRNYLQNHPLHPQAAAIVQNLSALCSQTIAHIQHTYVTKPETVFAYSIFGAAIAIFVLVTLSNLINLYLFVMVLFFGPISLAQYYPNFAEKLFTSIVHMTSQTISEEDLVISQVPDCDNDSQASDFSTESYVVSLLKNVQHMPSHLEVDEDDDDDDDNEVDGNHGNDSQEPVDDNSSSVDSKKSPVDYVSEFSRHLMSKIWTDSLRITAETSPQLRTVADDYVKDGDCDDNDDEPVTNDSNGCDSDDYEIISREEIKLVP